MQRLPVDQKTNASRARPCARTKYPQARDLKNWLTVYGYWNQGGLQNVVALFSYLSEQYLCPGAGLPPPPPPVETPPTGCLHPDAPGVYFKSPAEVGVSCSQERLGVSATTTCTLLPASQACCLRVARACCFYVKRGIPTCFYSHTLIPDFHFPAASAVHGLVPRQRAAARYGRPRGGRPAVPQARHHGAALHPAAHQPAGGRGPHTGGFMRGCSVHDTHGNGELKTPRPRCRSRNALCSAHFQQRRAWPAAIVPAIRNCPRFLCLSHVRSCAALASPATTHKTQFFGRSPCSSTASRRTPWCATR